MLLYIDVDYSLPLSYKIYIQFSSTMSLNFEKLVPNLNYSKFSRDSRQNFEVHINYALILQIQFMTLNPKTMTNDDISSERNKNVVPDYLQVNINSFAFFIYITNIYSL